VISTLAIVSVLLAGQAEDFASLFEPHEHRYTGGNYRNVPFQYRLFKPSPLKPAQRYPLLLWLHGHGEAGSDSRVSLRWLELAIDDTIHPDKYPFFILVVQCPSANPDWFHKAGGTTWGNDMTTVAAEVLRKTMREYPVDDNRVYLGGVSSGGSGCWEMAMRYPELFAAVVPMSSGGGDVARVTNLKNTPIWAFHNLDDDAPPPDGDKAIVAAVNSAGGNAYLTFPPAPGWKHDSWTAAFQKHEIMAWMLAQRRSGPCWVPPGCRPWKWRSILAMPAAILTIAWLAWQRGNRKRRKRLALAVSSQPQSSNEEADFILCLPDEITSTKG
jgi:poly(3-hydroxybutyrate) depolymerase